MAAATAVEVWRDSPEGSTVVRQYLKLLRVLGCCFVEGLFAGDPSELEAAMCSWYLAYSLFILLSLWVTAAVNIVHFLGSGTMIGDILGIASFMYSVQLTSVVAPAFFSAHNIVQALEKSACFERSSHRGVCDHGSEKVPYMLSGHRLPNSWERSLRRTFAAVVAFIIIQTSMKIYFYVLVLCQLNDAFSVARFAAILAIMTVATVWSGAPAACTVLAGRWLSAHIRYIRVKLELVAMQRGNNGTAGVNGRSALFTADMLAATRWDLSELRRILRAWNSAVQLGLLAQFASDTLGVCCALYILIAGETHCPRVVAQAMVRSALAGFALFAATWSSDDVAKQVDKLKYNIDSYVESGLVCPQSRKEFQTFLLSLSSKEFLFSATGFFDLKFSLLSKVAGGIFIHTTILIQMMRLGNGCVGGSVPSKDSNYTEGQENHLIATYFY